MSALRSAGLSRIVSVPSLTPANVSTAPAPSPSPIPLPPPSPPPPPRPPAAPPDTTPGLGGMQSLLGGDWLAIVIGSSIGLAALACAAAIPIVVGCVRRSRRRAVRVAALDGRAGAGGDPAPRPYPPTPTKPYPPAPPHLPRHSGAAAAKGTSGRGFPPPRADDSAAVRRPADLPPQGFAGHSGRSWEGDSASGLRPPPPQPDWDEGNRQQRKSGRGSLVANGGVHPFHPEDAPGEGYPLRYPPPAAGTRRGALRQQAAAAAGSGRGRAWGSQPMGRRADYDDDDAEGAGAEAHAAVAARVDAYYAEERAGQRQQRRQQQRQPHDGGGGRGDGRRAPPREEERARHHRRPSQPRGPIGFM